MVTDRILNIGLTKIASGRQELRQHYPNAKDLLFGRAELLLTRPTHLICGSMQRPFVHPATEDIKLESVLYALADPVRLAIVKKLAHRGCPTNCQTAAPENLPKSTQSHHYQVLREAGLIRSERRGTEVVNTLRCDEIDARYPGLIESIMRAARLCEEPAQE